MTKVFIIAEAGVNHDGSVDDALRLVDAAADAGADCVKFQTFSADALAAASAGKADYQKRTTEAAETQRDMLRRLAPWPGARQGRALAAGGDRGCGQRTDRPRRAGAEGVRHLIAVREGRRPIGV